MAETPERSDTNEDASTDEPAQVASSTHKVVGEFSDASGAGVLGKNTAASGTPIGVEGAAPTAEDGFGLSTPDDVRIEGEVDTDETDFVVNTGTRDTIDGQNVVLGHSGNEVSDGVVGATISGGGAKGPLLDAFNEVTADYGTIAGGSINFVGGEEATVCGGQGNRATGVRSTVVGGLQNKAQGDHSFAAGNGATADADGAFVWADGSDENVTSTVGNEFKIQAGGGVVVYSSSDRSTGVSLSAGSGSWSTVSTRAAKTGIEPVDPERVLDRVTDLTVSEWEYDAQDGVTHMGPMAEAFHDAFGLGADDEHITGVDADGVAFAAIQGLSSRLDDARAALAEKDCRIAELEATTEVLHERLAAVEKRLDARDGQRPPPSASE